MRHASLKGRHEYKGEKGAFKPKGLYLYTYNLVVRIGAQVDLAMYNFDFSYTIKITMLKKKARTNTDKMNLSKHSFFKF